MGRLRNRGIGDGGRERRIAALATAQRGLVSLEQLHETGLTTSAVAARAQQGTLHRQHRAVYAVGHPSLGVHGRLHAALLACSGEAVISHGTAAALWGLRDRWPTLVDVTARNQRGRKIDGLRCRRCRYPSPLELEEFDGLAVTSPARTIVDLAGILGNASLRRLVERAAVRKLLDLPELDAAMRRARGRRGIARLDAILVDWRPQDGSLPDVRSEFEALVLPQLLARGLPRPGCNVPLRLDGELLIPDFLWLDRRLVVETDGRATHETPPSFQADRRRDQLLVAASFRVQRVTWDQIHREGDAVVARIARALGARSSCSS